jgi:very-short-patch-repair endonuclease
VASYDELTRAASRRALRACLADGSVLRVRRGLYGVPEASGLRQRALALGGVIGYRSAALSRGWPVLFTPPRPEVIVGRGRNLTTSDRELHQVSWRRLPEGAVDDGWRTTELQTVLDCAASLDFREALAVADSALRAMSLSQEDLTNAAAGLRGRGRRRILRVLDAADARAANPFESALRALCLDIDGLHVEPQARIEDRHGKFIARVDLADRELRIVVEGDSFAFHSAEPAMLEKDCRRYSELAGEGYAVLRTGYHQLARREAWIRKSIERTVASRNRGRTARRTDDHWSRPWPPASANRSVTPAQRSSVRSRPSAAT